MSIQQLLASYGASGGGGGDPDFASVVSLLHFDGTNGSTTFTDVIGKTWTANGSVALSTTDPKFGEAALSLTGGYASTPDSADWHFGSGDFTIEMWVKPANTSQVGAIAAQWDGALGGRSWIVFQVGGAFQFSYSSDGFGFDSAFSTAVSWSTTDWQHIAISCNSGTMRGFFNGTQVGTNHTRSGALHNSTLELWLGNNFSGGTVYQGGIDDLRITKGVGRYTANFTPPTAPFPDS